MVLKSFKFFIPYLPYAVSSIFSPIFCTPFKIFLMSSQTEIGMKIPSFVQLLCLFVVMCFLYPFLFGCRLEIRPSLFFQRLNSIGQCNAPVGLYEQFCEPVVFEFKHQIFQCFLSEHFTVHICTFFDINC